MAHWPLKAPNKPLVLLSPPQGKGGHCLSLFAAAAPSPGGGEGGGAGGGAGAGAEVIRLRSANAEVIRLIGQRADEVRELAVAAESGGGGERKKRIRKVTGSGEFIGDAKSRAAALAALAEETSLKQAAAQS